MFINKIVIDWNRVPYDSYVRRIPALKNIATLSFSKNITIFTGENGSGKSTLLEAMAVAYGFNPEGGTWNYNFSTRDSHSELYDGLKLIRDFHKPHWGYFLRAESFYNVASAEEVYAREEFIPSLNLHNQSHGESFLKIVQTQFKEDSLYFLDEPEAALSPQRQLTLLIEISQLAQRGAQFFIVTHSPILLGIEGAELFSFDGEIHSCTYEETSSYQITKMFVNNREYFLKKLLEE